MAELTGSEILAKCLKAEGVEDCFFIMGGPMLLAESSMIDEGIHDGDLVVVAKGLSEGDSVIVGNLQKIGAGLPVQPVPAGKTGS